ncbi:MAG: Sec-independent protein translocase subunit TatA [Actinomycetes bacterium]|jgi:sec-independent protein translocase protein TatA
MPSLGAPEIILILLVVLLLFGAKRLPDAARGLGRSMRIFKSEIKAAQDEDGNSPPQQIQAQPDEVSGQPQAPTQPQSTTPDTGNTER